jgi:serine/threonine protein kinase
MPSVPRLEQRYALRGTLGQGAMGTVYRAYDHSRKIEVALKTLGAVDASCLYQFKREFRALSDVLHPNLVLLYELAAQDDQWFFTMELIDGVDFLAHVRPGQESDRESSLRAGRARDQAVALSAATLGSSGVLRGRAMQGEPCAHDLDLARLRSASVQLVRGLGALHRAGKLHRDVKPSNVLVTREGRVAVCDFGLVAEAATLRAPNQPGVGTPSYMAPEQALGDPLSAASDFYAVGVMLFEALTGVRPFRGSFDEVLDAKQRGLVTMPHDVAESVSPQLAQLTLELLAPDPRARPAHDEILRRLGRHGPQEVTLLEVAQEPAFFGRRSQLEALRHGFARSRSRSLVQLIVGLSGMGKTALARAFLDEVRASGALVLEARCYQREEVPYKALDPLVDALSNELLALDDVEGLFPEETTALVRLFPVLARVPELEPLGEANDLPSDLGALRRRAMDALREILARLSRERRLVVFIDDLQWGDADSAPFLRELIHHAEAPHMLLLAAVRAEERDNPVLEATLRSAEQAAAPVEEIQLAPLEDAELHDFARALLGAEATPQQVASLVAESAGSPLLAAQLAIAGTPGESAEQGALLRLDAVLRQRFDRLAADERRLLEVIAVAGRPLGRDVLVSAAGLAGEGAALTVLANARLVRTQAGAECLSVECYHDRIREALVAQLGGPALLERHAALVRALRAADEAPEELVPHLLGAGDREAASRYADIAARRAGQSLAFHKAAELYKVVLDAASLDPARERETRARLAHALAMAGRPAEAGEAYLAAAEGAAAEVSLARRSRAAQAFINAGELARGLDISRAVLESLRVRMPRSRGAALFGFLWRGALLRLRGLGFRERPRAQIAPAALRRLESLWQLASGLSLVEPAIGRCLQMKHTFLSLRAGDPYWVVIGMCNTMGPRSQHGFTRRAEVQDTLAQAGALADKVGDPYPKAVVKIAGSIAVYCTCCAWVQARDLALSGQATLIESREESAWEQAVARSFGLASIFKIGDFATLGRRVPVELREAIDRGDQQNIVALRVHRGNAVWLAHDRPDEARHQIASCKREPAGELTTHDYYAWMATSRIDLYEERAEAAHASSLAFWAALQKSLLLKIQLIRIDAWDMRVRVALAAAAQSRSEAHRVAVQSGIACLAREPGPWPAACAALHGAGLAELEGRRDDAVAQLRRACEGFTSIDMGAELAYARRQLGALLGGDEGRALARLAEEWMRTQGLVRPERFARLYTPAARW